MRCWRYCFFLLLLFLSPGRFSNLKAQVLTPKATLSGTVSDPSGARVRGATAHVSGNGTEKETLTDAGGGYSLALGPGTYELKVAAPGFETFVRNVTVAVGVATHADAALTIATQADVVDVVSDSAKPSTSAGDNRSALVFKGAQLETLSDDDATLQQQILAVAGGDGQHPPQIYVDGFSGGQFPPKSAIREVRINQNPYSAQYDSLGFGRVEFFTKPGSDKLHGSFALFGNDSTFNSRNPFNTGTQPPYFRTNFNGSLTGPINSKTSFFLNGEYNNAQNNIILNSTTLDDRFQPVQNSLALPDPRITSDYSARLDRQLTTNNTFTARYDYAHSRQTNGGVAVYVLPSQAFNNSSATQTLQLGNTEVIGTHVISETRFQYIRTRLNQSPVSTAPSVTVQGAFSGGGSPSGSLRDNQENYEFQQYMSIDRGKHFIRAGMRYRLFHESNQSSADYNGQFVFPSITAYQLTQQALAAAASQGLSATASDALVRATCQQTASGQVCGGATQFSLTAGQSAASVYTGDLGLYAEDEWKLRKDLTLNYGVRFESQSSVPDHFDPAPRAGIAWAVHQTDKKPAFVVLRAGGGIFYDRFVSTNLLTSILQGNGAQQAFYVQNPQSEPCQNPATQGGSGLCGTPTAGSLGSSTPNTTYRVSPQLRSAYLITFGGSAEFTLGKHASVSTNLLHDRGVHQWLSRNINAPLPGTYNPSVPGSGVRPLGSGSGNLYQFVSGGDTSGTFWFSNGNLNFKHFSAWAFYVVQASKADSSGAATFASNQYDTHQDYGDSTYLRKQQLFSGFDAPLFKGLELGSFLIAWNGRPFNITTGTDLNGDTQYNDRPAFATDLTRSSVVRTAYGNFDTSPITGQTIIPINYGHSPGFLSLQTRLVETIKFGPRPPAPPLPVNAKPGTPPPPRSEPRYSLRFSVEAQNLTNHVNPAPQVGVLTSPYFGQSIASANNFATSTGANRSIMLRTQFRF